MAFHTLYTTNSSMEAHLVKAKLIESGIEVFLKDEITAQVTSVPLEVGGVKVQVLEQEYQEARNILIELGYISENEPNMPFLGVIDEFTLKIPVVKNWASISRLVFFVAFVIVLFIGVISLFFPSFQ